jgi:hypothetical protein
MSKHGNLENNFAKVNSGIYYRVLPPELEDFQMDPQDDPALERIWPPKTRNPTEDQIAEECKKIQSGWDTTMRRSRSGRSAASKTEVKVVRLQDFFDLRELPDLS